MGTIDDIQFLLENSVEESYLFIVDSDTRDRSLYPEPNMYAVQFDSPFQNVVGIDIIDGTIPRTQYAVDTVCKRLCLDYGKGPMTIDVTAGDHTDSSLVSDINSKLSALPGCTVSARSVSTPPELKNLITFTAPNIPFHIFADERSTIKPVIGFDEYAAKHRYLGNRFACRDPVHAPAVYSSVAKDPIPASTFPTQDAADTVIPFADPSAPTVPRLVGIRFSPEQSGLIDRITLAFNIVALSAGAVSFYLASDDEVESAPGAPLCPPTSVAAQEFGDHGLTTLQFQTEMGLTVGKNAWLVVSARGPADGLYAGSSGNALVKASSDGGASWNGWTSGGWNPLMNVQVTQSTQTIIGPGILNLVGDSYCMLLGASGTAWRSAYLSSNLTVGGSITGSNGLTLPGQYTCSLSVAFDTVANGVKDVATFTCTSSTSGQISFDISVILSQANTSTTKRYLISTGYNVTTGAWQRCIPLSVYSSTQTTDNYELQMQSTTAPAIIKFRLVHSVNSLASTPTVNITATYAQNDAPTFANTVGNAQYTNASWATYGFVSSAALTQVGGQVGVGTLAPSAKFHVSGGSAQFDSNVTVASTMSCSGPISVPKSDPGYISYTNYQSFSAPPSSNTNGDIYGYGQWVNGTSRAVIAGFSTSAANFNVSKPSGTNFTGFTDMLRVVSSNGNVGINNTSPTNRLDVGGTLHATGTVTFDINMTVSGTTSIGNLTSSNITTTGLVTLSSPDQDKIIFTNVASGSKIRHNAGWTLGYYAGQSNASSGSHQWNTETATGWVNQMTLAGSNLSVVGNITASNAITTSNLSATGTVTLPDGSLPTSVISGLGAFGGSDITTTGNLTAGVP
jgi:hypothetical protein